jgi:hypothetical protein
MRRRVRAAAIPEEPWRLRNVPVGGERTVERARALRGDRSEQVSEVSDLT